MRRRDAFHITKPAPNHEGAQRAMQQCLDDAKISLEDVGYVNAHGTSTPAGRSRHSARGLLLGRLVL